MNASALPLILAIEDDPTLGRLYAEYLKDQPYQLVLADTGSKGLALIEKTPPALLLLDLQLPDMHGLDVLKRMPSLAPNCPVVVVTSQGSVKVAVEAMQSGALDFIVKPFPAARLLVTLQNALKTHALDAELAELKANLERESFCSFIGASEAMQAVYRLIESVAPSRASVFITGESGTGKELAAEAVHRLSPRREKPFIALNCAAIPHELMESEIFGHIKGSFTGAVTDRAGAAKAADGGTLFLDEIGDMPLDLQVKLLRFIQTGSVQQVGSARAEKVDVRFIAATHRDPAAEVEAGRFREDLYYRLHVVPLHLPPLRERGEDVLQIADALLRKYAQEEGKNFEGFAADAAAALRQHEWPGNVRQLQNVVRQAVVLNEARLVSASMLQLESGKGPAAPLPLSGAVAPRSLASALGHAEIKPLWLIEKEAILAAIKAVGDDVPKAAALLEVSPSTLYRKLQGWKKD